jgi:hypothetical protein
MDPWFRNLRNRATTPGILAAMLLAASAHASDQGKKIVSVAHNGSTYTLDAESGADGQEAYATLVKTAKESYQSGDKVSAVILKRDGNLVYTIEPDFFTLVGANQVHTQYRDAFLQRILGTHSHNPDGSRAYGAPRRVNPAGKQRLHRKQFDSLIENWTGSSSKSLDWTETKDDSGDD